MSEVNINYKGSTIASMDASGTKTLQTSGKYCEDDVEVVYTRPATPAPSLQTKSKTYIPTTSQQTESIVADSGYDGLSAVNVTVNAMPSGTAGTPTATKGTVSNHSVSVTPSVTNTTGYITGSTKTGAAVTVSASELVSGNKAITQNGTNIDVTNYATVSVNVAASANFEVETTSVTSETSISFTVSGEPRAFTLVPAGNIGSSASYIASIMYDGSNLYVYMIASGSPMVYTGTAVRFSYSQSTLTISTGQIGPYFQNYITYKLLNVY